jgi:hypothetical protein
VAQFARPDADTTNEGAWTDQAGGSANLFSTVDEAVASDSDYVRSAVAPTNDVIVFRLSDIEDPLSSSGHVLRWRRAKDAAGGAQIDMTVQLRQGYVNESTLGTLIASKAVTAISETFTDDSITLSGAEADAITNYADLFVRILANQV